MCRLSTRTLTGARLAGTSQFYMAPTLDARFSLLLYIIPNTITKCLDSDSHGRKKTLSLSIFVSLEQSLTFVTFLSLWISGSGDAIWIYLYIIGYYIYIRHSRPSSALFGSSFEQKLDEWCLWFISELGWEKVFEELLSFRDFERIITGLLDYCIYIHTDASAWRRTRFIFIKIRVVLSDWSFLMWTFFYLLLRTENITQKFTYLWSFLLPRDDFGFFEWIIRYVE